MTDTERYSETIEPHFPITVLARQYNDAAALNDKLFAWIKDMAVRYGDSDQNASRDPEIATKGGYQTSRKMNLFQVERPEIRQFRDRYIRPAVHHYLHSVFGDEAKTIDPALIGWSNLLGPGDWQGPHMHPTETNLASGVYYVRMPEITPPEGCIEFLNPHPISQHHGFNPSRRIVPSEGLLLLFPPFYLHYVHPLRSSEDRAIIAFDVQARKGAFNFIF
ncbi:MAG: putative 2OG-Fe(II) oxygenase [Gammaproteobacteria bacterium]